MKKSSKLIGVLLATGMFLGACDKNNGPAVNPTDNNKSAEEHVHSFGEWEVKKEATCKEAGSKERKCSGCDFVEKEELPQLTTHLFGDWEETAATCDRAGKKERTCAVCGTVETEDIAATGHSYGDWQETPATCAADGVKERTCTVCGALDTQVLPKLEEHSFDDWIYDVANDEVKRVCAVCGEKEVAATETPEATWAEADAKIIDDHFYGANIPYMAIEGETELEFSNNEAVKNAPNSTAEMLTAYYQAFGDNWVDNNSEVTEEKMIYRLTGLVETAEGKRYVNIYIYGMASGDNGNYITADGSGTFVFVIEDPYAYSISDTYLNLIAYYYFKASAEIPDIETEAYFEDYSGFWNSEKTWYTFCYGDIDAIFEEFTDALIELGYGYAGRDNSGYYCFVPEDEEVMVGVGYNSKNQVVIIRLTDLPGIPEINGDVLTGAAFNIDANATVYQSYEFTGASGAKYLAVASPTNGFAINKAAGHGIVVTESVGTVSGVKVKFNNQTAADVEIEVYASNEPFTIEDMFDEDNAKGLVMLGALSVDKDFQTQMTFQTEYKYVGFKVVGGTAFIDEITVAWTVPEADQSQAGDQ